jgi:hypothetical protein
MSADYPLNPNRGRYCGIVVSVLVAGLAFAGGFIFRHYWEQKVEPQTGTAVAPILAQAILVKHGPASNYDTGRIGIEGKIYNPNPSTAVNVRVVWKIYPEDDPQAELFERRGFQTSCEVEFAYIPPRTTYNFKTNTIKFRSAEQMDGMGRGEKDAPMDLTPRLKFEPLP